MNKKFTLMAFLLLGFVGVSLMTTQIEAVVLTFTQNPWLLFIVGGILVFAAVKVGARVL
jgi:hypothetical protein